MSIEIGSRVMVRSHMSGVFGGVLKAREGNVVTLTDARRIHYWDGAASISELAIRGSSKPGNCRFAAPVPEIMVYDVIEIDEMTPAGVKALAKVPVWTR